MGVTGRLLWPSPSTAPRAKITLSFEIGSVARVTLPTSFACSQSGLEVDLHRTSYPEARGDLSQMNVLWRGRRRRQRCQRCGIQTGHIRHVIEVDELGQIAIFDAIFGAHVLMLVVVIFAEFGKSDRREAVLVERRVIASAQIAIRPEYKKWRNIWRIGPCGFRYVAGQLA